MVVERREGGMLGVQDLFITRTTDGWCSMAEFHLGANISLAGAVLLPCCKFGGAVRDAILGSTASREQP